MGDLGKWLLIAGAVLMVIGLLAHFGWLGWFGRLPGDIRVERPSVRFYLPLTSMLITSAVLSLAVHLIRKLLG